jgi:hypothetical protein
MDPELEEYLWEELAKLRANPPTTDFQRGYEAAITEVAQVFALKIKSSPPLAPQHDDRDDRPGAQPAASVEQSWDS